MYMKAGEKIRMNIALILSGGTGVRLGADIPKQYIEVGGRIIISYCMEQLMKHEDIDYIQIAADETWHDLIRKCLNEYDTKKKFKGFSKPGKTRQLSVFNGLTDIKKYAEDSDCVLIHDAARPSLSKQQITDCIAAIKGYDGVLPVLPMKDTVYLSKDGKSVSELLNRNEIFAGQAPELFLLGKYYDANVRLFPKEILNINGSTEPAILAGLDIAMIQGDENNYKITTKTDLERFEEYIKEKCLQKVER